MLTLDNREALIRVYDGSIDGVSVRVGAMVTKIEAWESDASSAKPAADSTLDVESRNETSPS